jgi:hypothetical protein
MQNRAEARFEECIKPTDEMQARRERAHTAYQLRSPVLA